MTNEHGNRCPLDTPSGRAQTYGEVCDGVWGISTASHGGYYVEARVLDRIPEAFRNATFTRSPRWFEEDVDWAIVVKFFPEPFPAEAQEAADFLLRKCHAGPYRAHFGAQP
jgi:hypothetical protein